MSLQLVLVISRPKLLTILARLCTVGELGAVTSSGDDLEQRYDCFNLEFYSDCELLMR